MDTIAALKLRRSVRIFASRPIDREVLADLVDCGRLAPSGHGKQGRYFLVLTERSKIDGVGRISTWGNFMVGEAAACIVVFSDEQECATPVEDGAVAAENILLAAEGHGLASCWVAGYGMPYAGELEKFLEAPANLRVVATVALGHPAGERPPVPAKKELNGVIRWDNF